MSYEMKSVSYRSSSPVLVSASSLGGASGSSYQESFSYSSGASAGGAGNASFGVSLGGASLGGASFGGASLGSASFGLSASNGSQSFNAGQSSGNVNRVANDLLSLAGSSGSSSGSFGGASFSGSSSGSFGGASAGGAGGVFLSQIEQQILRATVPIESSETEEITVIGQRGIWLNKSEVNSWRGDISITEYQINEDSNPEVINKSVSQSLEYVQELAIKYLRPPTPPAPGEIVIVQQGNSLVAPAPPLIIRQQPARPTTPEPLVIREAPPQAPQSVGRKVITIGGKRVPPPPRKVIIERLAPLPAKPQSVLVERWLPYQQVKRRVIFQKGPADSVVAKPRNVIVQWAAPQVSVRKEIKYLGVIRANPVEYVSQYGASLKAARDLPQFVLDIKAPSGVILAADSQQSSVYELEGDLQAFQFVDLDREGLSEYRVQLQRMGISFNAAAIGGSSSSFGQSSSFSGQSSSFGGQSASFGGNSSLSFNGASGSASFSGASSGAAAGGSALISQVFASLDVDKSGSLSLDEARRALLLINSRLGRSYGENDVQAFFQTVDLDRNGSINLDEFRKALLRLIGQ